MGRLPKPPEQRLRRNALMPGEEFIDLPTIEEARKQRVPPLPPRPGPRKGRRKEWGKSVKEWWHMAWKTPMAKMWLEADAKGTVADLLMLRQDLIDVAHPRERVSLLKMIRTYESLLGFTELDRRRLRWRIPGRDDARQEQKETPEVPKMTPEETRVVPAPLFSDPRRALGSIFDGPVPSSNGRESTSDDS